jgi:hypothetical protein
VYSTVFVVLDLLLDSFCSLMCMLRFRVGRYRYLLSLCYNIGFRYRGTIQAGKHTKL